MNVGRGMLGLAVVVAVACAGWFGWKAWWKPAALDGAFDSMCGYIDHSATSGWVTDFVENEGHERATIERVTLTSDDPGLMPVRVLAVPSTAGIAAAYGVGDFPVAHPALFAATRAPEGIVLAHRDYVALYVEARWNGTVSRADVHIAVTYRTSAGFDRTISGVQPFTASSSSTTQPPECR